jgi:hypothetical protein
MKYKKHFNLLIKMNKLVIDDSLFFTNAFPIENENKESEAAIVPKEFLIRLNADRYHDCRPINASA